MSTVGALYSSQERLNHLLGGESAAKKEVVDGVEQLNSDLGILADCLSDDDATVNGQVRELAHDIEDSVECFVRRLEVETPSISEWKWSSLWRLLNYWSSYERSFLEDLHAFSRRAMALVDSMGAKGISTTSSTRPPQLLDPQFVRETVGLEESEKTLKRHLLEGEEGLLVIGICGMGGMGKTTLALMVYNDMLVRKRFDCRAWLTVGYDYQARRILESIFTTFSREGETTNYSKLASMETMKLAAMLYKSLKGRRYLICLDDVWSTEAWDSLRFFFPDDHNGSRILIATSSMEVARYTSMPRPPILMQLLTEEQSWQLFLIKSGLRNAPGMNNPQIAELGKQIVKSCRGLPLAIIAIGQLLSTMSLQNWELVLRKLHSEEEHVHSALELCYTFLPHHLKSCFLYMGQFPRDQPISVDKLHLLWMAEGLISKRLEEAAEDYLNELVDRNLVIGVEKDELSVSRRFRTCQIHDTLRDLCISIGKLEEFSEVIDFSHANKLSTSTCRLAVYLNMFKDTNGVTLNIPDAKRIRTILFFDSVEAMPKPTWPSEVADLRTFQHIRVLDFGGVNFLVKRLPWGIENLIHLRYLSFRGCYLQEFPSSLGNLSFLETLDLCVVDSCIMTIPNDLIRKLTRLRHLYFPLHFRCDGKDKLKLDTLKNLEVVENFHTGSCDVDDLLQLQNLQILKGTVEGNNMDLANVINSIKKMKSISHSSLVVKGFDCYSKERLSIVADLLKSNVLHSLELEGHLGTFPDDIVFGFNFTEMVFSGSEFSENPITILGNLPNLRRLVLCNDAFVGPNLVCYESNFPQLTSLKLANLRSLVEWEVENGAMPTLTNLIIEQCDKLEMIPSELASIPTLQKVIIGSMPKKFQLRVKEIIEEGMALGNEEISFTFYECEPIGVGSNQG